MNDFSKLLEARLLSSDLLVMDFAKLPKDIADGRGKCFLENELNRLDCRFFQDCDHASFYQANYFAGHTLVNFWRTNNPVLNDQAKVFLGICTELVKFVKWEDQSEIGWEILPIVRMWSRSSASVELETAYRTDNVGWGEIRTVGDGKIWTLDTVLEMLDSEKGLDKLQPRTIEILG